MIVKGFCSVSRNQYAVRNFNLFCLLFVLWPRSFLCRAVLALKELDSRAIFLVPPQSASPIGVVSVVIYLSICESFVYF